MCLKAFECIFVVVKDIMKSTAKVIPMMDVTRQQGICALGYGRGLASERKKPSFLWSPLPVCSPWEQVYQTKAMLPASFIVFPEISHLSSPLKSQKEQEKLLSFLPLKPQRQVDTQALCTWCRLPFSSHTESTMEKV